MRAVETMDLTKTYFRKKALDKLSITIEENKMTGLVGRNGAGKTTLLNIIAGLIKPTSGEIKVFSHSPFNSLHVSANSILVDDRMSFPQALPLREILQEAARFYPNWDGRLAGRLCEYFSLDLFSYHHRLSKGKTSQFNAIVGLASRCPLTLFDEPASGMDEVARKDFYRAVLKDYLAFPRTIILSSHHLEEMEDLLEDILILKNGRKFLHTTMPELQDMAIEIKGTAGKVLRYTKEHQVIHHKSIGTAIVQIVMRNGYSEADISEMKRAGLEVSRVDSSDLFVYLTNETKGGIDDVFKAD